MFSYREVLVAEQRRQDMLKQVEHYRILTAAKLAADERYARAMADARLHSELAASGTPATHIWAVPARIWQRALTVLGLRHVAPALPGKPPPT
ncbi:MAG: hypothetical protein KatS3mg059_0734 [Thermomicrobiales bacterium]|nr:MAG: hypothetical protein KatS3mg059_0734 [Thermomicrobiales bacterium]